MQCAGPQAAAAAAAVQPNTVPLAAAAVNRFLPGQQAKAKAVLAPIHSLNMEVKAAMAQGSESEYHRQRRQVSNYFAG